MVTRLDDDVQITGSLSVGGTNSISDGSVTNAKVAASAAIDGDKVEHIDVFSTHFGLEHDATPSTGTTYSFIVGRARSAGTIRAFRALLLDTGSQDNTNDFDFELLTEAVGSDTPTTVLSSAVEVDSDIADNTAVSGTISSATLAAGDLIVIQVTTPATITGANGMYAEVVISQNAT